MKYRKRPIVVEAWPVADLLHAANSSWRVLPASVVGQYGKGGLLFLPDRVDVRTEEGTMRGERGDMLIRGVKGEFYPCKSDIFNATYEPVNDDSVPEVLDGETP